MPIYYVVIEMVLVNFHIPVHKILKVIECELEDYQKLYDKELAPLLGTGRQIQAMFFYREPANPFKDFTKEV